jgi:DNA-directed RNA polymerase specialized sigma subunit
MNDKAEVDLEFDAIMSDDLFKDESDELADEFFKTNDKEYVPLAVKKTNANYLSAEAEFNVFIDMRNIKRDTVSEYFSVPRNVDLLHRRIVQIHNKEINYADVISGTYPDTELKFISNKRETDEPSDVALENVDKYESNDVDVSVLSKAFMEIDRLYHKHMKSRLTGDLDSMKKISKQIGAKSRSLIFSKDALSAFKVNSDLVARDMAVFGLELRTLLVDDCNLSGPQFRTYIEQKDNPIDKKLDEFKSSLERVSGSVLTKTTSEAALKVYNLKQALGNKFNMSYSQIQSHIMELNSFDRANKKNVETLLKANINWIYTIVNKRVKNFPHPSNDIRNELSSAAVLGYTQGIERYRVANGNRLNAYATHYAELFIRNASNNMFNTVVVPEKDRIDILKIKKYKREYYSRFQKKPSDTDIADALDLSFDKVIKLDAAYSNLNTSSLNDTMGDDGEATKMDFVEGGITTDWEQDEMEVLQKAFLTSRISLLEPIEQISISFTDPLMGEKPGFLDVVSRLSNIGVNSAVIDSYMNEFNIDEGKLSGGLSEKRIELISGNAKLKLKELSFLSSDTIDSIAYVKDAIVVCKNAPNKIDGDVVSAKDVSDVLLADLSSLKDFIGVVVKSGVKIDVCDVKDCLDGVTDVDFMEFKSSNASNIGDLGYETQGSIDVSDINLMSYENENIALRNRTSHTIASLDVLKARIDVASELNSSFVHQEINDLSLENGVTTENNHSNTNNVQTTLDLNF